MSTTAGSRDLFGQPRGLTVLFLTQMWEIFSYYGMRSLLVYYMTKQLLLEQQHASLVYGAYTATVYFTPIIGGVISDRWLGRRRAVIIGASIMALGHFLMASESLFYVALAAIALGNGLFLPSLPSQIDGLYAKDDPRRGSAYNVYYVGINVGGLLAPLVCGTLGEVYGWHYGFGAAGLGMLAGLLIYVFGARHLPEDTSRLHASLAPAREAAVLQRHELWQRVRVLAAIALTVMLFRGAYEQLGNTIALWADTGVDRMLGGFTIPMTWFQSLNPLLVIVLTPLFVAHWTRQARHGREPTPARKMAMGAAGVACAYLMLAAVSAATPAGQASWVWLALFFLVLTSGELFILPVGLGLFARLAPAGHGATTIAAWFFATFGGSLLAGVLGTTWSALGPSSFFVLMGAVGVSAAALLWLLDRPTRRVDAVAQSPVIATGPTALPSASSPPGERHASR
ncbi:peptide MFS transporter [Lysobacter sp. MMG2]|uniref:peptide MFS transporter n=1 Tax=Lysobacter sp. MMG2 TaxID=2801338 RepID=UPI001C23BF3C|nr:peptide MFS transporter [Lysobacter sp. MMG2]MBU8976068.1 peptide MFS transporter [Lysobacter sp. MMG2]